MNTRFNLTDLIGQPNTLEPILVADCSRGQYVGQHLAELFGSAIHLDYGIQIGSEDLSILSSPEHEHYCEVWADVADNGLIHSAGDNCQTYHFRTTENGDAFLVNESTVDSFDREHYGEA